MQMYTEEKKSKYKLLDLSDENMRKFVES